MQMVRSILSFAWAYRLFDSSIGGPSRAALFVQQYMRSRPGDRILDIGCGPGNMFPFLPETKYTGFDMNPNYIAAARSRYGNRAAFYCQRVSDSSLPEKQRSSFDVVLAMAVVHHLDDAEALSLFRLARAALRPGGRLLTCDGCYTDGQHWMARYLLSKDRGRYVRTREGYLNIATQVFRTVRADIRHDLIRIPYTHVIMECTKDD